MASKHPTISITWNPKRKEETWLNYSNEFFELDWISKVDMLKDAIGDLTVMYDHYLKEERKKYGNVDA
jgi:hypothetical protein